MKVLSFVSLKGGSGKSTLAGHLAVQAILTDGDAASVALLDTNPHGSLKNWCQAREGNHLNYLGVAAPDLAGALNDLEGSGTDLAIIDTPPAMAPDIAEAVRLSDLIIIPIGPSPHDLQLIGATLDLVESYDRPYVFVVSGALKSARLNDEAIVALSQHGTVSPVIVYRRADFVTSMVDGRTVMETANKSQSAKEIRQLWNYITDRMKKLDRRAEAPAKPTTSVRPDERRKYPRWNFERPAVLYLNDRELPCTVYDISVSGALIEAGEPLPTGVTAAITISGLEQMEVEIVYAKGAMAGLQFAVSAQEKLTLIKRLVEIIDMGRKAD